MRMPLSSRSGVIICPNPKCHKEIEEPILLNNMSMTPPEQYYACPRCLIKLDTEVENEKDTLEEHAPSPPMHPSLEKVLDAISASSQREIEDVEDKEEGPVKPSGEKEKVSKEERPKGCPHHFGYLAQRPKNTPFPQECLTCQKIVECMLKL
jgi:hypothetical protein